MSKTHLLSNTFLEKKVKKVDFFETLEHLIKVKLDLENQVPSFRSLLINKALNQLIDLLNNLTAKDITVLNKHKFFALLNFSVNEIYESIKDPKTTYLEYDRCIHKLYYFFNVCSLKFKHNKDNIKKRRLLTYYKGFTIKSHPFGRSTMGMRGNKYYETEDEEVNEQKVQEHAEHLYFHHMTQQFILKFYPECEDQMKLNNMAMQDFGDKTKIKNPFKPKHKPRPKGLKFINPTSKKK